MESVEIAPLETDRFERVLGSDRYRAFARAMEAAVECFADRVLWCVNSTAKGGGVAELLGSVMGYLSGAGIDARWAVIEGDDDFFALTKRIHNRLHGDEGDGGPLGAEEREVYERALRTDADELADRVGPGDVVVVHDPQPAGLIPAAADAGATVVWRCHVGVDDPNDLARSGWEFLGPYVSRAEAAVFSRRAYAWPGLDRIEIVPPSIDAFSPKNQDLDRTTVDAILSAAGIQDGRPAASPEFVRRDGSRGRVERKARLLEEEPLPDSAPLVVQVSRWDRLKDPSGVIEGFVARGLEPTGAHLMLAGPQFDGVADDPEAEEVLAEVERAWRGLPSRTRSRVHLASLPAQDDDENSAMVNALQRRAQVVVQKSLAEGFGLTVAEAMWKERPVVASRVGGIQDQIVHGESGLLVDDPEDLDSFGRAVAGLLGDPEGADRMGRAARRRVCDEFLATSHLERWLRLLSRGAAPNRSRRRSPSAAGSNR